MSPDQYELRRSYQFEVPPGLIADTELGQSMDVLLPVCWMAKHALLEFDLVDDSGGPLYVLERKSIAGALSVILDGWREDIPGLSGIGLSPESVESVCVASLDPWETARELSLRRGASEVDAVCDYLARLLPFRVAPSHVSRLWSEGRDLAERIDRIVGPDVAESEHFSTLAYGAILAPYLVPRPSNPDELAIAIGAHQTALAQITDLAVEDDDVRGWLGLLAESGRRWPLLTRTEITAGKPFLVKMREVRDSGDPHPNVFVHRADLTAARSYHLQIRVPDQSVLISGEPEATAMDGTTRGTSDLFENTDMTLEQFATYTSMDPRPDRVDVTVRFKMRWQTRVGYWFALVLTISGLAFAFGSEIDAELASVLTIPTTIVSAFLVARDTPLTARYLQWHRLALVGLNLLLWGVALYKLATPGSGCSSC
jgi:hypothetical protein